MARPAGAGYAAGGLQESAGPEVWGRGWRQNACLAGSAGGIERKAPRDAAESNARWNDCRSAACCRSGICTAAEVSKPFGWKLAVGAHGASFRWSAIDVATRVVRRDHKR